MSQNPPVTICVLTYGDYPELAERSIGSIVTHLDRAQYRLVVGANAVCAQTAAYLEGLLERGTIDRLERSEENINKCPMMRRMFDGIDTDFIWWFDDDSWVEDPRALDCFLEVASSAPQRTAMWGLAMFVDTQPDLELGKTFAPRFRPQCELVRRAHPAVLGSRREGGV